MSMTRHTVAVGIGTLAIIQFAIETNWVAALSLFLVLFANNLSQANK